MGLESDCLCDIYEKNGVEKSELEIVYDAYDKNGGAQNMERNLDSLLENYPTLKDYKLFFLDVLKQSYCVGFLEGYLKNKN
jgi:hypothetical protein